MAKTIVGSVWGSLRTPVQWKQRIFGPARASWTADQETLLVALRLATSALTLSRGVLRHQARAQRLHADRFARALNTEAVTIGSTRGEWFRSNESNDRVLLYFHGGGYALGSIDTHRNLLARLCVASGMQVLAIDYRLSPEHRFGAQLADACESWRWLLDRGVSPKHVAVAGESAGGNLALATLARLRDDGGPLPACGVLISPWLQLEANDPIRRKESPHDYITLEALELFARLFVTHEDEMRHPHAAPIHADLARLPPLLVQAGGCETLLDDSIHIAARARDAGVDATLDIEPDMVHANQAFPTVFPQAKAAIDRIGRFVRRHTI